MKRIINLTLNAAFCPLVSSYRYRVTNVLANMTKINGDEHHIKLERSESAMLQTAKSMCISTQMSNSTAIMQTLVATTAVRQINKNIKINLIAPYFPYTQQDRFIKGGSFTLKLCCDLFNAQKYNSILIMDPHSNVTSALLNNVILWDNNDYIKDCLKDIQNSFGTDIMLVGLDARGCN